jgi:hypothetical protein
MGRLRVSYPPRPWELHQPMIGAGLRSQETATPADPVSNGSAVRITLASVIRGRASNRHERSANRHSRALAEAWPPTREASSALGACL